MNDSSKILPVRFLISFSFLLVLALLLPGAVLAVDFPQAITIQITVSGSSKNFTVDAGSELAKLVVDASSFTITASAGHRFTVTSSDKYTLINDGGYSTTCASNQSSISITIAAGAAAKTVKFTPDGTTCAASGGGSNVTSGGGGGGASSSTPTSSTPAPVPTSSPLSGVPESPKLPGTIGLKDGDLVSGAGDSDIFIVNKYGYKRLFLNPVIFNFYGHLGGFSKVKKISAVNRDAFVTSGIFRNCEVNDPKVYAIEVTAEDKGTLHWVNTTGSQAVADDPNFFKKVFCINNNEFNWYPKGTAYTSVKQVPNYSGKSGKVLGESAKKLRVGGDISWLNVRATASTKAKIVGKVYPGEEFDFTSKSGDWYKIQKDGKDFGWVSAKYVILP